MHGIDILNNEPTASRIQINYLQNENISRLHKVPISVAIVPDNVAPKPAESNIQIMNTMDQ